MAGANLKAQSDLPVRIVSAVVMLTVAGTAVWLGGWAWVTLVMAVALGVLWEWRALAYAISSSAGSRTLWMLAGMVYIGIAALALLLLRHEMYGGRAIVLVPLMVVIATDVGAYFAGRAIGGPKIAPAISPSKTWAGLAGGMIAATLVLWLSTQRLLDLNWSASLPDLLVLGPLAAILAQAGDFFESWMKRRAGVKDSGNLIPGHGGLFDRVDGLLAVLSVGAVLVLLSGLLGLN